MTSCCAKTNPTPSENNQPSKPKKYKQRLFIGEGDFSYTEALINKHINTHKHLAQAIVATELFEVPVDGADAEIINQRINRINSLKTKGVRVIFGIDGRELHTYPELKGERFKRIHWNCPYRWPSLSEKDFMQVIVDVFNSCDKMQLNGDRIHITLIQGESDDDWYDLRQYLHNLVKGSLKFGYTLVAKRSFGKDRYPGYQHRKGENLEELHLPDVHREYVFEKDPDFCSLKTEEEIIKEVPVKISNAKKTYSIDVNRKKVADLSEVELGDLRFVCSTDDDSSDYDSSD